jgi:hypothetical protein
MFGLTTAAVDPFDALVEAAQAIVVRREKVLGDIRAAESNVADADDQVRAAGARVAAEEYAAAQEPGGLAVASKGALAAVAAAELAAKSCRLRLQGLQTKRAEIEGELVPAWSQLEAFRDEFFRQRADELAEEADRAVESLRGMICKALAFRHHVGAHYGEKYGQRLPLMINSFTSNAHSVIQGRQCSIQGGIFSGRGGKKWSLVEHWNRDAEASSLDAAIRSIKDRMLPIGAVAAAVQPK